MNKKLIIELMEDRIDSLTAQLKQNSENSKVMITDMEDIIMRQGTRITKLHNEKVDLTKKVGKMTTKIRDLETTVHNANEFSDKQSEELDAADRTIRSLEEKIRKLEDKR